MSKKSAVKSKDLKQRVDVPKKNKMSAKKNSKTESKVVSIQKKNPSRTSASPRKNSSTVKKEEMTKGTRTKKSNSVNNDYERARALDLYRRWGHLSADIDPLKNLEPYPHKEFDSLSKEQWADLESYYCGKIGSEFMHMVYSERCEWIATRLETPLADIDERKVLKRILSVETFEKFLHTKYVGAKRFSLEGLASVVPLLDSILDQAAENGVENVMLAMAHRGRLNVMHHIVDTLAEHIVANFEDVDPRSALGGDDVKYHKGATGMYVTSSGKTIEIELAPNPSHLEAVNAVIMGRTKARQVRLNDPEGKKILCIILHGDAAFAGQGIAAEALNYAEIPGFSIGGTLHIIVNNLIGFTATQPALYC